MNELYLYDICFYDFWYLNKWTDTEWEKSWRNGCAVSYKDIQGEECEGNGGDVSRNAETPTHGT